MTTHIRPITSSKNHIDLAMTPIAHEMRPSKKPNRGDGEEEQEQLMMIPRRYQQYKAIRQQQIFDFYLSEDIGDPAEYTDMIHTIRTAQPVDIINIHLNTPGGRLDTGIQMINAIQDSQARIVGILDSKAYSLGTLLFLACDEFIIHDNCLFMIHNFSSGTVGKGNEQLVELNATIKWFSKIANKYYYPFLSKDEIDRVLRGEDMWMDSDEVKKRLKQMVQIREEEANAPPATKKKEPKPRRKKDQVPPEGVIPSSSVVTAEKAAA